MDESQSERKSRITQRDSSLTKREMEAALQLVQLSSDSRDHEITDDDYTAIDRKVKEEEEEEESEGDKSFGQRKRKFRISIGDVHHRIAKALCDKHGQSRRTQNEGKTTQPEAKAAQQLILLFDNSESHKKVKAKEEENEETNSNTSSIITNVSSAMETQLEINAAQQMLQLRENSHNYHTDEEEKGGQEEEIKSDISDLSSAIKRGFCQGKRRFRSVVEIYRTTKPLNIVVNAKKLRCF